MNRSHKTTSSLPRYSGGRQGEGVGATTSLARAPSLCSPGVPCGIWLDLYAATPDGARWYKPADTAGGFTGVPFTADGKIGAWAKIVDGNIFAHPKFGEWKLEAGGFVEEHGV